MINNSKLIDISIRYWIELARKSVLSVNKKHMYVNNVDKYTNMFIKCTSNGRGVSQSKNHASRTRIMVLTYLMVSSLAHTCIHIKMVSIFEWVCGTPTYIDPKQITDYKQIFIYQNVQYSIIMQRDRTVDLTLENYVWTDFKWWNTLFFLLWNLYSECVIRISYRSK